MVGGSGEALLGVSVLLGAAELYLLPRYFVRNREAGLGCLHDRRCELGHVVMTVAMIGMLVPVLNPLPPIGWAALFLAAAGAFAVQGWRSLRRRHELAAAGIPGPAREAHHVLANLAMAYMALALPMPMPGAEPAIPPLFPAAGPAQLVFSAVAAYFLGHTAVAAYRIAAPARRSGGADASPIMLSPRALSACQVAMGVGMVYLIT